MSRPIHIAALDEALEVSLIQLDEAEKALPMVLDKNLSAHYEVESAFQARSDAFYVARQCEDAIRQLGYVVLKGSATVAKDASRLDGRSFSAAKDWEAARERAAEPSPTTPSQGDT